MILGRCLRTQYREDLLPLRVFIGILGLWVLLMLVGLVEWLVR